MDILTVEKKTNNLIPEDTSQQKLRILVAEDNLINQKLITTLIEKAGHEVLLAQNGKKAISMSNTQSILSLWTYRCR